MIVQDNDEKYKMIIIGNSGVGKSSLLRRLVDNVFPEKLQSTIGVDFQFKTFHIEGKSVRVEIWDTAGSEQFRSIVSAYYRGCDAVVLVFSLADILSFSELEDFWIHQVETHAEEGYSTMLLGNKADNTDRFVKQERIDAFLKKKNIPIYKETSAKTGNQVFQAFQELVRIMMKKQKISKKKESPKKHNMAKMSIDEPNQPQQKKKCCQ